MNYQHQKGFVALISVLIMSAVLLVLAVSISQSAFFTRFNILDAQDKTRSLELAKSCVDVARLRLAENLGAAVSGMVSVGNDSCSIQSVQTDIPYPGQVTIQATAVVNQAETNLEAIASTTDWSLISWQEVGKF